MKNIIDVSSENLPFSWINWTKDIVKKSSIKTRKIKLTNEIIQHPYRFYKIIK